MLLLRQLGESDESLLGKYLEGRSARMRKILAEGGAVADAINVASAGAQVTSGMLKALEAPASWGFAAGAMPSLKHFFKALDEKLINAMQARRGLCTEAAGACVWGGAW